MDRSADIAIIGAGIVGLAHAYMALKKGYKVVLFERDDFAVGASIRNFGLLWPIGQEPGPSLDRALRSRQHWLEISQQAGIWLNENGSLHLAYHDDEREVLEEFVSLYKNEPYDMQLLSPAEVLKHSPLARFDSLKGGLLSKTECTVYSREAIKRIPMWLNERFGVILRFGQLVREIALPIVETQDEQWSVQHVFVCSGADFQTLYPTVYQQAKIKKCKLQMLRARMKSHAPIGPSLCAGLTLRHYDAFRRCPSLTKLDKRYDEENLFYKQNGIHVLLAQNPYGELIIGDSHHYGSTLEPFDAEPVNESILHYLNTFLDAEYEVTERWHGIYPKLDGKTNIVHEVEKNVTIVNGLGGAGMTLSFGLAEENLAKF
jgi:D-hydroxyproline dehydrogenase subunit beta